MYDIIGDIHGQASKLEELLLRMEYKLTNGYYSHSERKAIFVGDYIDRGPEIQRTLEIIKKMVDAGSAFAIMGNHEMGIIRYFLLRKKNKLTQKQIYKLNRKHSKTLRAYKENPLEAKKYIKWFKKLPLYLDLPDVRIVHACWDFESINWLKKNLPKGRMNKKFIKKMLKHGSIENKITSILLNGYSIFLPEDKKFFINKKQISTIRIKWWINSNKDLTYNKLAATSGWKPSSEKIKAENLSINLGYPKDEKPVFFGHYWREGIPSILDSNIACVDYGAAKKEGMLVAYRFNNEKKLSNKNFITHKKNGLFESAKTLLRHVSLFFF